jgi:N-acetyl-gamma-glutamyl-phosphate reductase
MKAAIVGAAGYTGGELIRILTAHPHVDVVAAVSSSSVGKTFTEVFPSLMGRTNGVFVDAVPDDADVVFLCVAHGKAAQWLAEHSQPADRLIIDLSADHRLDSAWTYGLPEANRTKIATARRIANPGCFATAIELALLPLANAGLLTTAHVTALTGSTGAGQQPTETTHFSWRTNNASVYKAFEHQHLTEIHATLGTGKVVFIPMRAPWARGIIATCVVELPVNTMDVVQPFATAYANEPATHVVPDLPDVGRVVHSPFCYIGFQQHGSQLLVVSVIDNLLKGASAQAVQNMNIAFGMAEMAGLLP